MFNVISLTNTLIVSHVIESGAKYYHYTPRRGQQLAPTDTIDINSMSVIFVLNCDTPQCISDNIFVLKIYVLHSCVYYGTYITFNADKNIFVNDFSCWLLWSSLIYCLCAFC